MAAITIISSFTWGADKIQITEGDGVGGGPEVVSASSTGKDRILVTFDREMLFHPTLSKVLRADSYQVTDNIFHNKLYVARCFKVSDTEIELLTQDQRSIPYTVVVRRVQDQFGNVIGSSNNSAIFLGTDPATHFPSASKIYSFWGLYGGMETTEQTALFPDIEPPYLENQDPSPGELSVGLEDHIVFDIVDAQTGVDTDYTVVWFDGTIIWENDAPKPGWTGSRVEITTQRQRYDIVKDTHLPEGKLCSVEVLMRDTATLKNPTIESYGFTTASVSPYLQNQFPAPGSTGQDPETDITLEVVDDDSNIVPASVVIKVDGVTAWLAEAAQPGFAVAVTPAAPNGYRYVINPDVSFPEGYSVTVEVQAADDAPNPGILGTAYTFQTVVLQGNIYNHSFEIPGDEPGEADGWTVLYDQAAEQIAPFEGSLLPVDSFEVAWGGGNQLSHQEFDDEDMDAAGFNKARAAIVEGGGGVPWGSGIWGASVWGGGPASTTPGEYIALVEEFMWEWRHPRLHRSLTMSNFGRLAPAFANPEDTFDIGKQYRDMETGGLAYAQRKPGSDVILFHFVDWLNPVAAGMGFCRNVNPGGSSINHILYERNVGSHKVGVGGNFIRQFTASITLLPIHERIEVWEPFFRIKVTIGGTQYEVVDAGGGELTSSADLLDPSLPNGIDYETGDLVLGFRTAPDDGTAIWAYFEYGRQATDKDVWKDSPLPYITVSVDMDEASPYYDELPPYNHSSSEAFSHDNLMQAEIGGTKQAESFEATWQAPNTMAGPPWNEDSQDDFDELHDLSYAPFTGTKQWEDFEQNWGWGGGNQTSKSSFSPSDLSAGPAESFESGWNTIPL